MLVPGGELYDALVSGVCPPSSYTQSFFHPLFTGTRFELAPGAKRLRAVAVETVDLRSCTRRADVEKGGLLYEAALRAGRQAEWGALREGVVYHLWATRDEALGRRRAFALRERADGTEPFAYSAAADCLELSSSPS